MIEEGMAGEEGFLSTNATANGEMPVGLTPGEVVTGTIGGALNSLQDAGEVLIDDFPSAMQSAASAIGESVSGCIDQGIGCVASDPREGYSGDRAFVDLLQGDKESAIGNNATAMAGEVLPAATVVNQAGRVVGEVAESIKEGGESQPIYSGNNGSFSGEEDFDGQIPSEIRMAQEAQDLDREQAAENNFQHADGSVRWPDNTQDFDKVPGSERPSNMQAGDVISRYVDKGRYENTDGNYDPNLDTGRYTAPENVPEEGRAMAGSEGKIEHLFIVKDTNPNDKQSNAAPYFDKEGLRIQYEHEDSISTMNDDSLEYIGPRVHE